MSIARGSTYRGYTYRGYTLSGGGCVPQAHPLHLPYVSPTSPLYLPQVEDVLRKHIHPLRECYQHYLQPEHYLLDDKLARGDRTSGGRDATSRGGDRPDAISRGGGRLCLEGWIAMLMDADLLDSCLTRQAAAHAFVSSQMLVTDEVRISVYLPHISISPLQPDARHRRGTHVSPISRLHLACISPASRVR